MTKSDSDHVGGKRRLRGVDGSLPIQNSSPEKAEANRDRVGDIFPRTVSGQRPRLSASPVDP